MTNSQDIIVTEGRAKKAVDSLTTELMMPKVNDKVKTAVENDRTRTGTITRFYPYIDRAEVKLDNTNEKILCKILHRYGGELIDFFTPLAERVEFDDKLGEKYIVPRVHQNVLVLKIHDDDSQENLVMGYFLKDEVIEFNPASPGNAKLAAIGVTNDYYIKFGIDGLSYKLPKKSSTQVGYFEDEMQTIEHYTTDETYSKEEVDEKIKEAQKGNDTNLDEKIYTELLEASEDYKQMSYENKYFLFRGDCWTINNNFESSAAITSESTTDFKVTGTFRTKQDLVGIYWNSEDIITHPYISYGKRTDYRNVVLEFDYTMTGCKDFSYNNIENNPVSLTIATGNGEIYYFNMFDFVQDNHVTINFDNLIKTAGTQYLDSNGDTITLGNGETKRVDVSDVKFIMIVLIPNNYESVVTHPIQYQIMNNIDFVCEITNISVTNGAICEEHIPLAPHKYRICEGYDDFYNLNPHRVCKEMRKLGYDEWCDLYIGASHFYEKNGTVGDTIKVEKWVVYDENNEKTEYDDIVEGTEDIGKWEQIFDHSRTEKMVLDKDVPLNKAFSAWLDCYSRELLANDCPNLVVSVSMENLQCPQSWRQKDCNGNYAITGWIPSTFFYSPCNSEVAPYMQSVSEACLDIVVANGMQPILQMGEAWWWWNENDIPVDPVTKKPICEKCYQAPCFYDLATRNKYHDEFGKNIPEYTTSWDANYDADMMFWLNKQLCEYSDSLRAVVKSDRYSNGLYMALFFPPSVTDVDRVPSMMQDANYLKDAYHPDKLDVLQIEDYDWVIWESPHHKEAYTIGQDLGFPEDRLHYFGGFVQYPEDARIYWRLIKQSMDEAIEKKFKEVYVWAGSQVRRDHKMIGYDKYELVQNLLK